jgi:hypothetical protein
MLIPLHQWNARLKSRLHTVNVEFGGELSNKALLARQIK